MKKKLLHLLILLFLASTGHAYYQTEQGRWLNRDPIGEEGGENLYAACLNQCVNHVDFLGLDDECPCTDGQIASAVNEMIRCVEDAIASADALAARCAIGGYIIDGCMGGLCLLLGGDPTSFGLNLTGDFAYEECMANVRDDFQNFLEGCLEIDCHDF